MCLYFLKDINKLQSQEQRPCLIRICIFRVHPQTLPWETLNTIEQVFVKVLLEYRHKVDTSFETAIFRMCW